ncbi:MAG: DUF4388 domain-containing protein [Actinomycetota bacterium]|nr:DUF4388 domain-containing protein [Actinomycetota bacterium]
MSLIGTVDTLPLPDLFEVLAAADKTGALHVRSEQGLGIVYFMGGKVCAGEAGHRSGPVDGRDALIARLFDVCFELFRFEEASFEFEVGGCPTWPAADTVEVPQILAETARRLAEWADIRIVVSSLDARPRLIPDAPEDGVLLDAAQWRVLSAIDGRRRINALIRVLDSSDFEVCGRLAGLVEAGLVALDAPETVRSDPGDNEPTYEFAPEPRRLASRPSRLAAVLDEELADGDDRPDSLDLWDEQVLATEVLGVRGFAIKRAPEVEEPEARAPEARGPEAMDPEEVDDPGVAEPEVVTSAP